MILRHELKANLKTFLIWTLIIAGMNFGFMLLYPSLQDAMSKAMDAYSSMGSLTAAFGMDRLSVTTPLGFYGIYVGMILSLGGALFSAMLGTGIFSKEEGGHTAEFLFTLPYRRFHILIQKAAAVFIMIFSFHLINLLLGLLSFRCIDEPIAWKAVLMYHTAQLLMQLEIAAISMLLSAILKKVSLGGGLGIAMLLYFADMMSRVLNKLDFFKYITPFYYANAADVIIDEKINFLLLVIGIGITVICLLSGICYYSRRDLAS